MSKGNVIITETYHRVRYSFIAIFYLIIQLLLNFWIEYE